METKYTTGQAVMVPAVVREALEIDGQIFYRVDLLDYNVPERDIEESTKAISAQAMRELEENLRGRWY